MPRLPVRAQGRFKRAPAQALERTQGTIRAKGCFQKTQEETTRCICCMGCIGYMFRICYTNVYIAYAVCAVYAVYLVYPKYEQMLQSLYTLNLLCMLCLF